MQTSQKTTWFYTHTYEAWVCVVGAYYEHGKLKLVCRNGSDHTFKISADEIARTAKYYPPVEIDF